MTNSIQFPTGKPGLTDGFGRVVDYLRVSVTDRCNFRCLYCLGEDVTFLPRQDLLDLDEMDRLCSVFIALGVRRLRLTGGEPLARRNIGHLVRALSRHLRSGALAELTMTTNGSLLADHAARLKEAGMTRINVSLDTLDETVFRAVTRHGQLARVLHGIDTALATGLKVKINTVVMRGVNAHALERLLLYAHGRGMDLTLIETMPVGDGGGRSGLFMPLDAVLETLGRRFTLERSDERSAGPARYWRVRETGGRLGLVTPLTHGFCADCNRVRLTCTGRLVLCLGQEDMLDLKPILRAGESDLPLRHAIWTALSTKPGGHGFTPAHLARPVIGRAMNVTGG